MLGYENISMGKVLSVRLHLAAKIMGRELQPDKFGIQAEGQALK
jgi:hypothetical protein